MPAIRSALGLRLDSKSRNVRHVTRHRHDSRLSHKGIADKLTCMGVQVSRLCTTDIEQASDVDILTPVRRLLTVNQVPVIVGL
jgi:hypothetical protein